MTIAIVPGKLLLPRIGSTSPPSPSPARASSRPADATAAKEAGGDQHVDGQGGDHVSFCSGSLNVSPEMSALSTPLTFVDHLHMKPMKESMNQGRQQDSDGREKGNPAENRIAGCKELA